MEALITGVFALVGALVGAALGRFWKSRDDRQARRFDWAVEVLRSMKDFMARISDTEDPRMSYVAVPVELEAREPSAVVVASWVNRRISRVRYALVEIDRAQSGNERAQALEDARQYHRDTEVKFARWAQASVLATRLSFSWDQSARHGRPLRSPRQRKRDGRRARPGVPGA